MLILTDYAAHSKKYGDSQFVYAARQLETKPLITLKN
jgi:hypothetical protein